MKRYLEAMVVAMMSLVMITVIVLWFVFWFNAAFNCESLFEVALCFSMFAGVPVSVGLAISYIIDPVK